MYLYTHHFLYYLAILALNSHYNSFLVFDLPGRTPPGGQPDPPLRGRRGGAARHLHAERLGGWPRLRRRAVAAPGGLGETRGKIMGEDLMMRMEATRNGTIICDVDILWIYGICEQQRDI